MDRNSVSWFGYIPAITTPFRKNGSIAWDDFAVELDWYVTERMHGVVVAGTSGEWFSLSEDERSELFSQTSRGIDSRITTLGGCNAYTADEAIRHARAAERAGLDGILLTPPPYVVPNRCELVQFYRDVSDATDIPICVYNWPRGCVVDMDIETLGEISDIDHVVAIKNSTGNFSAFLDGLYVLGRKVRYFNMPTSELGADIAGLGLSDGLMGAGGILGSGHPDFWRAIQEGDRQRAVVLGERDRIIMRELFNKDYAGAFGNAQAILKTALRLRGVPAGYVRRPLLDLAAEEVRRVADTLQRLGIEVVNEDA
ncbi:dihydrodipicolinate synthase/N-acetylneuraminate lyase [Bradyrhizobium sp. USDA 4501]